MGTYNKGILGPFSGKVGTVIGVNWRGKDIMRSLPKKTDRVPTETQRLQREKFAMVSDFLTPIAYVLTRYFGRRGGELTRRNQAMSYHMKHAVVYDDPEFRMLYNKVLIAKGDLPGVQDPEVITGGSASELQFSWDNNSGQGMAQANDQLVIVVYAPEGDLYHYLLDASTRDGGSVTITLPEWFSGLAVHSWITFASVDGKSYATSVYMGEVNVG